MRDADIGAAAANWRFVRTTEVRPTYCIAFAKPTNPLPNRSEHTL